ncbi:MAG: indole-3-glycerol phosphate synthase TrpC [Bacteroidia bacterium]|nr:indole-3-glycerol phosphate synthase TrpC [Bacteroidia bacterium]
MSILDTIIAHKRQEVSRQQELYPVKLLEQSIHMTAPVVSLRQYLLRPDLSGIIAEIKRKSPSQGDINPYISIEKVSIGYMQAGASALSVLTDKHFFGGSAEDLTQARRLNYCPILRKDFIIDEYQLIEARSIGADAVLLIASVLEPARLKTLAAFARSLGLETLLEVHHAAELHPNLHEHISLVGVNNRNLGTFEVSLDTSLSLISQIPNDFIAVAESGISRPEQVIQLYEAGFRGFLMGQQFMQHSEPAKACARFIHSLNALRATPSA